MAMLILYMMALESSGQPLLAISSPLRPFVEHTASGVAISGDLVVKNDGDRPVELVEVRLDTHDRAGNLIQRREINGDGISPSILTIADRKIAAHSSLLLFNPFQTFDAQVAPARLHYQLKFRDVGGDRVEWVAADVRPIAAPPSNYLFPLSGRVLVWDGHDFYSHHRRWNYLHPSLVKLGYRGNAGRYAYDFIAVDEEGRRSTGDERINRNWFGFGKPVRATASGIVEAVTSKAADDRTYRPGSSKDPNAVFGNYIVLRHRDGTFSVFGHLKQGSARVKKGEFVRAGDLIAEIGASGDSLFPHLHYQRTLQPADTGEGAPVSWRSVIRLVGKRAMALPNGYIDTGDVVRGK
jgi:hypothetical protein